MKKIVIITWKKSQFKNSWVWKYIWNYIPFLEKEYDVEIFYQPENHNIITWNLWRLFKLPRIIQKNYKWYIKIMSDESLLISVRKKYINNTISIIHHYPFETKVSNFKEHIIRWVSFITFHTILKKIEYIIAVSNKTKNILENLWIKSNHITVIPNSIDLSSYKILNEKEKKEKREKFSKKYTIPKNKKWLLYVWSNESRKNLLTLFKTLNLLSNEYILVRVWKDVSVNELEKMNKIINENKLIDRYYHLQDVSEEDLISLYQISDIYIMPSLYEWFWRPIIEAQACWCPVISTKCWALQEVCWDWALLINDPFDTQEYANKIMSVWIENTTINLWVENAKKYSNYNNWKLFDKLILLINNYSTI